MNDTDSEGGAKDSSEEGLEGGADPKLLFIQRLMGMNFQRPSGAGGLSGFISGSDSFFGDKSEDEKNKTDGAISNEDGEQGPKEGELPWG